MTDRHQLRDDLVARAQFTLRRQGWPLPSHAEIARVVVLTVLDRLQHVGWWQDDGDMLVVRSRDDDSYDSVPVFRFKP